jgi:hypothetical protein
LNPGYLALSVALDGRAGWAMRFPRTPNEPQ